MAVELQAGMMVGRYRLARRLASGGMGAVWAALDERLDREVAVKVLPRVLVTDPSAERRFEREARAMGRLHHPNVVAVFDVGTADPGTGEELPYLVMELISGRSLAELIREGPLEPQHAASIMHQVALALAAAHDAGVIHRDLKPSNIMVGSDGHVKVLDFGLARLMRSDGRSIEDTLTVPGMVLGSCPYMAPEQARGTSVSTASDLFAAGAVLYEALAGVRAFQGTTPMQVLQAVVRCRIAPLEEVAPDTPAPLAAIVERCLQREPDRRYASAADLAADLGRLRQQPTSVTRSGSTVQYTSASVEAFSRKRRRDRWLWSLAAGGAAVAGIAVGAMLGRSGSEPIRPDPGLWSVREIMRSQGVLSDPSWSPDGSTLALHRSVPGRSEIVAVDLSSGERWTLVESTGSLSVSAPRFSPDGRALLVKVVDGEHHELQVRPAIGGEPVAVLVDALHGAWVDAAQVVFSRQIGGTLPRLYKWRVDTGDVGEVPGLDPERAWWSARPGPRGGLVGLWGPSDARAGIRLIGRRGRETDVLQPGGLLRGVEWYPTGDSLVASLEGGLVRIDAGGVHALLPRMERVWDPSPSPDGSKLAVTRRDEVTDLISVDPDGGGWSCVQCRVPNTGWGSVAIDGSIAYRRTVAGTSGLFLIDTDGVERRLTPADEDASCPAFSPDGRRVAYLVTGGDTTTLEVIARDGGPPLVLAEDVEASEYPSWSPDGRFIVHAGGTPLRVRVVSAVGGAIRELTPEGGDYPVWSPRGDWIAYSVWTDPSDPLQGAWVVSPSGGAPRKVGELPSRLAWSRDGTSLYQLRRDDDRLELWQAAVDRWDWRRRAQLDIGARPQMHMEHLPFTVDPVTGRLILNRRSSVSSLLVYEGVDPERW